MTQCASRCRSGTRPYRHICATSAQVTGAHIESRMSRCGWVGGLGWATPGGGQARIRSHRPVEGLGGWGRQVIIRTASAMRQPVDRVRPHPDLNGLPVSARTVSLLSLAQGKRDGIHHRHGEREPNRVLAISSTGVSPCDRVRAIQPTSSLPAGCAPAVIGGRVSTIAGRSADSDQISEARFKLLTMQGSSV